MLASEWDWDAVLDVILEEAEEDAAAEAEARGVTNVREQTARRLLSSKFSFGEIAEFTMLPLSKIQDIARQIQPV